MTKPLADEELKKQILEKTKLFKTAVESLDKDCIRKHHIDSKNASWPISLERLARLLSKYSDCFISGEDLDPNKISISLKLAEGENKWADLFLLCRSYWSLPFSKGYGRRLRYVVFDDYHKSVVGIIGLQSPPADLAARDKLFDYPPGKKLDYVNSTMDAYTLGALPPYSAILGGKLIASLVASTEIRQHYWKKYAGKRTLMNNRILEQPLTAITTTSAYGRSSIYNRLKYRDELLATKVGYTKGFGMVHLESLCPEIDKWLKYKGLYKEGGYGNGPKIRWQNATIALDALGLDKNLLAHGLKREVFVFQHCTNLGRVMSGDELPIPTEHYSEDLFDFWLKRWGLPRVERDNSWKKINSLELVTKSIDDITSFKAR